MAVAAMYAHTYKHICLRNTLSKRAHAYNHTHTYMHTHTYVCVRDSVAYFKAIGQTFKHILSLKKIIVFQIIKRTQMSEREGERERER